MNNLFDNKDYYTDKALELHNDACIFLRELARNYHKKGFSLRQIGYVLFQSVSEIINELILEEMVKK